MSVKVEELMSASVVTVQPHHDVGHVRGKMAQKKLHTVPVVAPDGEPVGVVSAADLLSVDKDGTPVSHIMTKKLYTIPEYEDTSVAARVMRNHKIHHLMVTREQKIVGVLSSFDLLKLVEGHRSMILDPHDPEVVAEAKRNGISDGVKVRFPSSRMLSAR